MKAKTKAEESKRAAVRAAVRKHHRQDIQSTTTYEERGEDRAKCGEGKHGGQDIQNEAFRTITKGRIERSGLITGCVRGQDATTVRTKLDDQVFDNNLHRRCYSLAEQRAAAIVFWWQKAPRGRGEGKGVVTVDKPCAGKLSLNDKTRKYIQLTRTTM